MIYGHGGGGGGHHSDFDSKTMGGSGEQEDGSSESQ